MTNPDKSLTQTDGYGQKCIPSTNVYSKQVSNKQQQTQMYGIPYQQLQPHFTLCYTCGVYGHLSKNCPQQALAQQNVPNYSNKHDTSSHTTISIQTKYPILGIS